MDEFDFFFGNYFRIMNEAYTVVKNWSSYYGNTRHMMIVY